MTEQPVVVVTERAMLLNLNQRYRPGMTPLELYEATRGIWRVGPRRGQVEIAMAVFKGIIREVYRVDAWHPAGTLRYETRDVTWGRSSGRWEFEGQVATDMHTRYVGAYVGKGAQNPVRYVNIGP